MPLQEACRLDFVLSTCFYEQWGQVYICMRVRTGTHTCDTAQDTFYLMAMALALKRQTLGPTPKLKRAVAMSRKYSGPAAGCAGARPKSHEATCGSHRPGVV